MRSFIKRPSRTVTANIKQQTPKERALDTMYAIKDIFESDDSGILGGEFYSDFMALCDDYIDQIRRTCK